MIADLLDYLRQFRPSQIKWDWQAGKHSNFPTCDILWFYARSFSGWPWILGYLPRLRRFLWWISPKRPLKYAYVRCPACTIRGRFVEMHICSEECAEEVGSTYFYQRQRSA